MESETRYFCRIEFSYRHVTRWDRDFDDHEVADLTQESGKYITQVFMPCHP